MYKTPFTPHIKELPAILKMKQLIIILFLAFGKLVAFGQYPFEEFQAITFKEFRNWKTYDKIENEIHYIITVPDFFKNHDNITIQLTGHIENNQDNSILRIYRNKTQIQKIIEPSGIGRTSDIIAPTPRSIYIEDINGDNLNDFKILIPSNACCGLYNYYLRVIILLQKDNGTFTKLSYRDLMLEYRHRLERDFDGDGNFEIVTQTLIINQEHNYWLFNVYNIIGNRLKNVNYKFDYPIMVQILENENYKVTSQISTEIMNKFGRKLPEKYDEK